jgi:hypothetical protein
VWWVTNVCISVGIYIPWGWFMFSFLLYFQTSVQYKCDEWMKHSYFGLLWKSDHCWQCSTISGIFLLLAI